MNIAFLAAAFLVQTVQPAPAPAAGAQPPATPTPAPAPARPQPSPELVAAIQAWGTCMDGAVAAVPATTAPEAGAQAVIAKCAAEQRTMTTTAETWIAGLNIPAEQSADMRARLATVDTGLEARVVERIKALRTGGR